MSRLKELLASVASVFVCIAVVIPAVSGSVSASVPIDGSLDTTFSGDGKVSTDIGRGAMDYAQSIAVQSDGKIIVVGTTYTGSNSDFAVLRYNTDGSLDPTFSGDGVAATNIGDSDQAQSVAIQSDGKIIVTGHAYVGNTWDFAVVRYNIDGSTDNGFGTNSNGIVTTNIGTEDYAEAIAIQPNGRIAVAGYSSTSGPDEFTVVRYNQDGSLDTTFDGDTGNANGKIITEIGTTSQAYSVAIQTDGKIVVGGSAFIGNRYDFAVVRYNQDGSLDTTFDGDTGNANGKVTTDIGTNSQDQSYSVALQGEKIVVAGSSENDFAVVRYNTNGTLDNDFSGDGKVTTDIGSNSNDDLRSVALQSDSKIIVSGTTNNDFSVVRYNSDGTLDTNFSGDGKLSNGVCAGSCDAWSNGVAVQANGKIIAVGGWEASEASDFLVARMSTNGDLDNTFGVEGKVNTNIGTRTSGDSASSVAVQTDGKIIVVGITGTNFAIARYNINGTNDTEFGDNGKVSTDIGTYSNDEAIAVAIQTDGKIVVVGTSLLSNSWDFVVVRYNSNGSLDTTFDGETGTNANGKVTTNFGSGSHEYARAVAIQADGKIIVAGDTNVGNSSDFAVVRYNQDGSLDTTFDGETGTNANGKITTDIGTDSNEYARSIAIQTDGKIIVAGETNLGNSSDFAVLRYNSNGSLDTTFDGETGTNANGKIATDIATNSNDYSYSVAVQPDGKIIVTGPSDTGNPSDFAVLRYNSNGSLDTTFDGDSGNANGKVITDIDSAANAWDYPNSVVVLTDGKILVAGDSFAGNASDFALVRYNTNGSLDTTFDGDTGNANGKVTTDIGTNSTDDAYSAAVQSDGKIIVVGTLSNDFVVVRYNATSPGVNSYPTTTTTTTTTSTSIASSTSTAPARTLLATTTTIPGPPSRETISALPLTPQPLVANSTLLLPGQPLTVSSRGFTAGEFVQLIVASTPQVIGSAYANADGSVTLTGALPSKLGAGKHTLAVYAPASKKGFRQPITVGAAKLPATGLSNQNQNVMTAMYLVILGSAILLTRRRLAR